MMIKCCLILIILAVLFVETLQVCNHIKRGLSYAEKRQIVKLHNEMRQKVASGKEPKQPTAANMNELKWNDELAAKAQQNTDTCIMNHDKPTTSKYDSVGQNIFWSSGSSVTPDPQQVIQGWYSEVVYCTVGILKSFSSAGVGHYTQLVWADTREVGCGFTAYPDDKDPGKTAQLITCNYGPSGNYKEEPVYKFGAPCSQCSNGCSKTYLALCSIN